MAYAINVRSDDRSSETIEMLWRKHELLEKQPSMRNLGYRPHITLGIYEEVDLGLLKTAFEHTFAGKKPVLLRFEALEFFESPENLVLWLKPVATQRLIELHRSIHSMIDSDLCREHYRPGNWVPHCSTATAIELSKRNQLLSIVQQGIEPCDVVFDVADYVSFTPVQVIQEQQLGGHAS